MFQNNLERQEFETRKALGKQVEELQLEMKSLRRNLDAQESNKKTSIGSLNVNKTYLSFLVCFAQIHFSQWIHKSLKDTFLA